VPAASGGAPPSRRRAVGRGFTDGGRRAHLSAPIHVRRRGWADTDSVSL